MTSGCPGKNEWLGLLDGEATENRANVLRTHALQCPACARELALQRQLIADLAAPVPVAPGTVDAIMRRLDQAVPAPRPSTRKWLVTGSAMVLAAAAAVLLLPRFAKDRGTFAARGGGKLSWVQTVDAEVFVLGPPLVKLEPGARVAPGVALVASYHNVGTARVYLMVVGRDARGEWHWLYPGFENPKSDSSSVPLEPLQMRRALPDSVVLDELPTGEFELITLIARDPIRVSRLEALPKTERGLASLRARFTDARITNIPLEIVPAPPAAPAGKDRL